MKPTCRGYDVVPGYLAEALKTLPQLLDEEMPQIEVIEHDPPLDSANILPEHWNRIAEDIARYYDEFSGFVVLHGTDTMAYSASALSFMLENLAKPVLFTGAQAPMSSLRTDARDNLVNSLYIASHYELNEVALCFHTLLLRGNRAQKISSVNYKAFDSPNYPALATIETQITLNKQWLRNAPGVGFTARVLEPATIASISLFPGMNSFYLERLFDSPLAALVVATYGMGNAPIRDEMLMNIFHEAAARGIILVNYTQCPHGPVDMSTYSIGQVLADIGFVSASDMTIEAVIGKLYYLLSCELSLDEVKKQFQANLRGELTRN